MNQYLLFVGDIYYPSGGTMDFHASFPTEEEAIAALPGDCKPYEDKFAQVSHYDGRILKVLRVFGREGGKLGDAVWKEIPWDVEGQCWK